MGSDAAPDLGSSGQEAIMSTMPSSTPGQDIAEAFERIPHRQDAWDYNFKHFQAKHLVADARHTLAKSGIAPGELAPDFELPAVDGSPTRLSALRGKPVLVHFGSFT
jgi:hypothetical protein